MKKLFLCFVALAAILGLAACNGTVSVKGISITSKDNKQEIMVDETLQLSATIFPENATEKGVVWSVSNANASVNDSGLVKGLAKGNVEVIATSKENKDISQKMALVVKEKPAEVITPTSVKIQSVGNVTEVKVGEKLQLETVVSPQGASQKVVWSSGEPSLATVNTHGEVLGIKEGKVTITAACKDVASVQASIEITVIKGSSSSGSFETMSITSHADFMVAEDGTPIKVKGVVTYIQPAEENLASYYIQNGVDGYYVYNQNIITYPVIVGKSYEIGGLKKYHLGCHEIVDVAYVKESSEDLTYTVNNLIGKEITTLEKMEPYHNSYIQAEGVISKIPAITEDAFSVDIKVGDKTIALRIDPSKMDAEEFTAISNLFKNTLLNLKIEFKGIMTAFAWGGKPSTQVQILKASDLNIEAPSPLDLIASLKLILTVKTSLGTNVTELELPKTVAWYADVEILWTSDNSAVIHPETGAVTHGTDDQIVTITATLKHKKDPTAVDTKEFKVNVFGTVFNHELLASLDCSDASPEGQYGVSETKPSYDDKKGNIVELGNHRWLLRNTLIAKDAKTDEFGLRMQNNTNPDLAGRVEIQDFGEFNYILFTAAIYGNDSPIVIGVEYMMEGTDEWVDSGSALKLSAEKENYRITLPEGSKRVAIYIIGTDGKRVNLDNIALYK